MGQAVDRHLLALKLQAIEEGLSVPRIFMDTAYGLATHWKLRTGQVTLSEDKHIFSLSWTCQLLDLPCRSTRFICWFKYCTDEITWDSYLWQVPTNTDSVMCFGPLVPDGYAVCYNPQQDHVHFSISAFNCCEETNAEKLSVMLERSLCDLQMLFQPPL